MLSCGSLVLILCVLILWVTSLPSINFHNITDFGLISALPLGFFVALILLTTSFSVLVHQRQTPVPILLLHIVVLVVIIHATLAVVYEMPRYPWVYKHISVGSYILRNGNIDPSIDIYHAWPGFFALSALFTYIAGFDSAINFSSWGPLFFNLLYLCPLLLIFRANTSDHRLVWLGVWFFSLAQWTRQDYFSPQALSYFFYLVTLGMWLKWFKVTTPLTQSVIPRLLALTPLASLYNRIIFHITPADVPDANLKQNRRAGLIVIIILMFSVIVSSHQLTPWVIIVGISVLVVFHRSNTRSMPILMGVMTATWVIFMATVSFEGYIPMIIQSIFRPFDNIDAGLYDLQVASPGRTFVALSVRGLTAAVWGLALLGSVRRLRKGYWDLSIALLAISPFLFVTQAYGNEMLFRVYMFSLPFMAFFAAGLLYPSPQSGVSRRTVFMSTILSCLLLLSFLFAYYGNERAHIITRDEINAVEYLYRTASPSSRILTINTNRPLLEGYEQFVHTPIANWPAFKGRRLGASDIDAIIKIMSDSIYPVNYLLIIRSQKEFASLLNSPPGGLDNLEFALTQSEHFLIIFANKDSKIFILAKDGYKVVQ